MMHKIKIGSKIMRMDFTSKEQEAINREIRKQLHEWLQKNQMEVEADILYNLHAIYGFGETRLRRFHDAFSQSYQALMDRYEMSKNEDQIWLIKKKLLEDVGIDIEQWFNESK